MKGNGHIDTYLDVVCTEMFLRMKTAANRSFLVNKLEKVNYDIWLVSVVFVVYYPRQCACVPYVLLFNNCVMMEKKVAMQPTVCPASL